MKLAIIGAGISGLVVGYRLQAEHDVQIFEAASYAGGHTNTVDIEFPGEHHAIDTGFIVYNDWTYPHFIELLSELGVASQRSEMSFSVCDAQSGLEYNGHSLNTLFAQRRNLFRPRFQRMLWDILRFNRLASSESSTPADEMTVGEFLKEHRFSPEFASHYLLPMGAAIWSCPTGTFSDFPIRFIAEFYRNHGLLNLRTRPTWRVVQGGSRTYVSRMLSNFQGRLHLRSPIEQVVRRDDHVLVKPVGAEAQRFDHVVFACHSDQALRILGHEATRTEQELLGAFPYSRSVATLHTDETVLPRSRRAWASWNYRLTGNPAAPATVTYNMNILQGLRSRHTFCVTLNDQQRINPRRVLATRDYEHHVFTIERSRAQARHGEVLAQNRTSFCGAYWRNGFHEDGVVSGLAVVEAIRQLHHASSEGDTASPHGRTDALLTGAAP